MRHSVVFYYCGKSSMDPGYQAKPTLRDHYLVHYIHSGQGVLTISGTTYKLNQEQGFIIFPGSLAQYQADVGDPWEYSWLAFNGDWVENYLLLSGLSQENPIFTCNAKDEVYHCLTELETVTREPISTANELKLVGLIYLFLSSVVASTRNVEREPSSNKTTTTIYFERAIDYIYKNYNRQIKVTDIANNVSVDRNHLSRIFKAHCLKSPQDTLLEVRMRKACELLKETDLHMSDIARSVGYEAPELFTKIFKKSQGMSPTQFRKWNPVI